MRKIHLAGVALFALVGISGQAQAQAPQCDPIQVTPADGGYQMIGIRRPITMTPKPITDILVEAKMSSSAARTDGPDGFVLAVSKCGDNVTRFQVKVTVVGDHHVAEIPVPGDLKSLEIRSCSGAAQKCYTGTYDGDPNKGVTLAPATTQANTTPPKPRGNYRF